MLICPLVLLILVSKGEKGLPEESTDRFKKLKDYGIPLGVMALSLVIVYILWASFGHIGPTFSMNVLTHQQEMLREKYKLPPLETVSGVDSEIPPSLREVMHMDTTKSSNLKNNTSETETSISESTKELQPALPQQPKAGGDAITLTILEGSATQGNPDYEPDELTVKKGEKILVDNSDTMPHTVTNGEGSSDPTSGKLFDTSIINGGESAEIDTSTIDTGLHPYYCMVHPYMTGSLTIN